MNKALLSALVLLLFGRLIFYYWVPQAPVKVFSGQVITGTLASEPSLGPNSQRYSLNSIVAGLKGINIVSQRYPELHYGDKVEIRVKNFECKEIGGCTALFPELKLIAGDGTNSLLGGIYRFRRAVSTVYQRNLPEPEAGLLSGMVLGDKAALTPALKRTMRDAGLTHVVAASGMNVSLIAGLGVAIATIFFNARRAAVLSVPLVWFYVLLSGGEAAVIRAGLMATFAFLARFLGRPGSARTGLVVAAALMLLVNPGLLSDLGFQLSVASTAGVLAGTGKFSRLNNIPVVGESLFQTVLAQAATFPILFAAFGKYNLFSVIINALTLWVVPYITVIGIFAGIAGLIWSELARLFLIPAYFLLNYFVTVAGALGAFPFLVIKIEGSGFWLSLGYYLLLVGIWGVYRSVKRGGGETDPRW